MAALILKGTTLGERQKHYNKALNEALQKNQSSNIEKINYDDDDITNLLKIDIANSNRNVEYILEVLKSEDMLYVSRAIKRCTWLITDPQYAHIVNPDYLHTQLFPQMTAKASNKLILHIKLNLRDEPRVEGFYNHLKNRNESAALRWLPYCSISLIEKEVESLRVYIDFPLLKRLCKRSFSILDIHLRNDINIRRQAYILSGTTFLIHTHAEKMFERIDALETYELPKFGPKITKSLMKKCSQKIVDNFPKYCNKIDLKTFAKYLKKEDIIAFLLKHAEKDSMKYWFKFDNLKHFIESMPKEGRFDFLKSVFVDKTYRQTKNTDNLYDDGVARLFCARTTKNLTSSANVYLWYKFASFDDAFVDLKKMIQTVSSPVERNAMLNVLINCASRNTQNIHSLLQYYHDIHINEPFKFKIQFVNVLLTKADTHLFDNKTWSILNNIFCSMEVYNEPKNNVRNCIQAIIVYKILHDDTVPKIIEKKFTFDTLTSYQKKLNKKEKDKVFNYLYNIIINKIQSKNNQNEGDFIEILHLLKEVLNLLMVWKRELTDYPLVIDEIKKLAKIKIRNSWAVDLSTLYNKKKSWKKYLFEVSLTLCPTEKTCINALKHDAELLNRHRSEVEALCRNDGVSLNQLLGKLRVYWQESLASEWKDWYLRRLDSPSGHKALVRGLCVLLPQKQLDDIVRKYAPTESKIIWIESNDTEFSLRNMFAKNVHIARPLPSLDMVLLYAHGDYLKFALPSLSAITHNLSPARSSQYITKFLEAPVSLKKHGIRLAFTKLESKELQQFFSDIWISTKNSTIRAVLFKQTYELLCREKNSSVIEEIWVLLNMFIDDLTSEEDKTIFDILCNVNKVPLVIRAKFVMKGYKYLKSLPAKANCEGKISEIVKHLRVIVENLDPDFVADILLERIDKSFATKKYGLSRIQIMSAYLLSAKNENSQNARYEKVLLPFLDSCIDKWTLITRNHYFAREALMYIIMNLCGDIQIYAFEKQGVFPVKILTDMLNKLERNLSVVDNYLLLTKLKLAVTYVKLLEGQKDKIPNILENAGYNEINFYYTTFVINKWDELYLNVAPEFGKKCINYLIEDMKAYSPSVYIIFAEALQGMFMNKIIYQTAYLASLKSLLGDIAESYLVVIIAMHDPYFINDQDKAEYSEVLKIIRSHPSPEVQMLYSKRYGDYEALKEV